MPTRKALFSLPAFLVILIFSLAGPSHAALTAGPWLQNVTGSSVQLFYEAERQDATGVVEFGKTSAYGDSVGTVKRWLPDRYFMADLTGLDPSTRYFYRLTHEGSVREGSFLTAPAPGEPFTFVVSGDTRSGHATHQSVVDSILAEGAPDLYFITGDLVASGELQSDWDIFFSINQDLLANTILCPVFGNHETGAFLQPTLYGKFFNSGGNHQFWYAFSYGNAHFIVINTEVAIGGVQASFVEDELASARTNPDIDFIFAFLHKPGVTSATSHRPNYQVLSILLDKFQAYNVDAVFAGHNHLYEHNIVNGVRHITTGGGGVGLTQLIDPYTPSGWTIVHRERVHHYCTITVSQDSYTLEAKYIGGTVFDGYSAGAEDGGFPGPIPKDLLDRSLDPGCGSYIVGALTRVPDVEASMAPPTGSGGPGSRGLLIVANGGLYLLPALLIVGLRRRFRGR